MKKILFILAIHLFIVGLSQSATTQKEKKLFDKNTIETMYRADSLKNETRKNDVNIKAVRDFIKSYEDIDNVKWYTVQDGFIAKFQKDGVETKVEYDVAGRRRNVLKTYDESHMSFELRDIVKKQYYDFDILVVYEIEHINGKIFIIKIMNKTNLMVLQVSENEMKVLEEYVNGNG